MNAVPRVRLPALFTLLLQVLLITGCASTDVVRGQLDYDLRPQGERPEVVWPQPPDAPRYRYAGELVGEPNFKRSDTSGQTLQTVLKWVVGLFEEDNPELLLRPQHGVTADNGRIYVADAGRPGLLVFDPNPPEDEKSKKDEKGKMADGQLLVWEALDATTRFEAPVAVALAWGGDIVVSDVTHGAVLRVNPKGELVGKIGAGQLNRPAGLAFDAEHGLLYVADTVAHDIKVFDEAGLLVEVVGSPGEREGELNAPTYLAFADNHLYVSDTYNNRLQVFDRNGKQVARVGERGLVVGNFARPKGVAIGDGGIVYAIESYFGHLLAYNAKGELLMGISGSGLPEGQFFLPSGVWTDKHGRVYVADMFNGRVVVFQFLGNTAE